jgi:tripartite-type tricarboxylate transporter receptor subunit TctC
MLAPAKTPHSNINLLNREVASVLNKPAVKERFLSIGVETVGSSPQQLGQIITSDMVRWGKLIKDAGIRAD